MVDEGSPSLSIIVLPGGKVADRRAAYAALYRQTLRKVEVASAAPAGGAGEGPRAFSPGSGLNLAAAGARAAVLAFIDPALVPMPDWAEQIVRWFALRPECAAVNATTLRRGTPIPPEAAPLHVAVRRDAYIRSGGFDDLAPWRGSRQEEIVRALLAAGASPDFSDEIAAQLRGTPARPAAFGARRHRPSPLVGPVSGGLVGPDGAAERPVASIVMPAWGRPAWAETCLMSILRQDFPERYEVIVPTDEGGYMEARISAHYPAVRTCRCLPEAGPGGARNGGLDAARGDFVAFLDGDCLPERDWLHRIVARCRRRRGAPVSGWLRSAYPFSWLTEADAAVEQGTIEPARAVAEAGLSGCNMCIGRALAIDSGARFAEGVFGAEDVALLERLPRWALPVVMDPQARALHLRRDTFPGMLEHQFAIGFGSGRLRRSRRMRGSRLARHPWAAPALVPGRLGLLLVRAADAGPRGVLGFARLSPLILPALVAYAAGFMSGAVKSGRRSGDQG
jgi:GT2 family glycosyltransferase